MPLAAARCTTLKKSQKSPAAGLSKPFVYCIRQRLDIMPSMISIEPHQSESGDLDGGPGQNPGRPSCLGSLSDHFCSGHGGMWCTPLWSCCETGPCEVRRCTVFCLPLSITPVDPFFQCDHDVVKPQITTRDCTTSSLRYHAFVQHRLVPFSSGLRCVSTKRLNNAPTRGWRPCRITLHRFCDVKDENARRTCAAGQMTDVMLHGSGPLPRKTPPSRHHRY